MSEPGKRWNARRVLTEAVRGPAMSDQFSGLFPEEPVNKRCDHCKAFKPLDEFFGLKKGRLGRQKRCKECQRMLARKCPSHSSASKRRQHLKATFGITPEQYDQMHRQQNGRCAICGHAEDSQRFNRKKVLDLDHCHRTGKVRALLCGRCNIGLGAFSDDPALLRAAADYLERRPSG